MVKDFHRAFGHPIGREPHMLSKDRVKARSTWMIEEVKEFIRAKTLVDQVDAIADLLYFALGTAVEIGINIEDIFQIVHEANMTKLGHDGRPIYREDGKVRKPEGWIPPEQKIEEYIIQKS